MLSDPNAVRSLVVMDSTCADYALCGRKWAFSAVIEAKQVIKVNPADAERFKGWALSI